MPKSEVRKKPEIRSPKAQTTGGLGASGFGLRISFGSRASDFGFRDSLAPSTFGSQRGIALVDCLAYIGLLAVILTMAFAAFYRATDHSRELSRNAADIARVLQAGERWRADVRASTRPPRLETAGEESQLRLAGGAGEVIYTFRGGRILRQALPNTNWVELLPRATGSRMFEERRRHVAVWHWEVELKGGQKVARMQPLFSFQAVASGARNP